MMDNIFITRPAEADRAAILDYRSEFKRERVKPCGAAGLEKAESFEAWLHAVRAMERRGTTPAGHVPADTYLIKRAEDGRLVGMLQLRHFLNDGLRRTGGHIGYSVRPSERRRGYASAALSLALDRARELSLPYVLITCDRDNAASAGVILGAGGVLEDEVQEDDGLTMRYWVRCAAPKPVLETPRLALRKMDENDLPALKQILQDPVVMTAYEGAFSDEETIAWLERQLLRYEREGAGLLAVTDKEKGQMIGQCGLTYQETPDGKRLEVGYLFAKAYWGHGYATEAARACADYAFRVMKAKDVCSIIRDTNERSRAVALRNGFRKTGSFIKHYRGVIMPHDIYSVTRGEFLADNERTYNIK